MPRQENTKELFIDEALKLFAERGYDQVKISDIAKAVGCVPSALYKHYENKEKLYEAMLEESLRGFERSIERISGDYIKNPRLREKAIHMTEEDQIKEFQELFRIASMHEQARDFRKLMTVEQFRRPELAKMYNDRYVLFPIEQLEALIRIWQEAGIYKEGDPLSLAVMYTAPLTVLIEVCDREPSRFDWALEQIERHIKEFNRIFRLK